MKGREKRPPAFTVLGLFLALTSVIHAAEAVQGAGGTTAMTRTESGLQYADIQPGTGREADLGDTATVHYTGWLADGTKFDSSVDRNKPFSFRVGAGQVIKGWDEGVLGMKIGGKRKLIIPPELAYGSRGAGGVIPSDATLTFEIELLDLR